MVRCCWAKGYQEPLYLVSNLATVEEACRLYHKRFRIEKEGWQEIIHRRKRCDVSLFQLGLRFLEHFLNEELPIPVQFHVTI